QAPARPLIPGSRYNTPGVGVESCIQIRPRRIPGGGAAEKNSGQQGDASRKDQRCAVWVEGNDQRSSVDQREHQKKAIRVVREQKAHKAAEGGKQQAFDEELSNEPQSAISMSNAHGE